MQTELLALIGTTGAATVAALAGWVPRFRTRQEKDIGSVGILKEVIGELRAELDRVNTDYTDTVNRLQRTVSELRTEVNDMGDRLSQARDDARGANETTGRAMRRVEHLELVLRSHGVMFEPGPLS